MAKRLLTVSEVSAYLGISRDTVYTQVSQRKIPFVKIGRLLKFDPKAIDDWIAQKTVMPTSRKRS